MLRMWFWAKNKGYNNGIKKFALIARNILTFSGNSVIILFVSNKQELSVYLQIECFTIKAIFYVPVV